ncbi:MAG: DUF4041 domain-containing protein [Chloroflexi bacterium]|nr:MAG: DUF4041 domain-containing protein [Chloroflexota bacterium]
MDTMDITKQQPAPERVVNNDIAKQYLRKRWYLHPLFISVLAAAWVLVIPGIIAVILLILSAVDDKKKKRMILDLNLDKVIELKVLDELIRVKTNHDTKLNSLSEIKKQYVNTKTDLNNLNTKIAEKTLLNTSLETYVGVLKELAKIKDAYKITQAKLKDINDKVIVTEEEVKMQEVGFYGLDFDVATSTEYKTKIIQLQDKQKKMVKDNTACDFATGLTYMGSAAAGKKLVRQSVKMALWSFNTHCDSVISKVTYRNRDLSERKIRRAFEIINSNDEVSSINYRYLNLKLEELAETYKFKEQLEHERELLREQREQEREDKKLEQEIARERAKIEKDETHISTEIARLERLLLQERNDKDTLNAEVSDLEAKLLKLNKRKDEVDYREANAKAGYVYVISNIGAFGEGMLKIGVTRRLEPLERVNELGDASVPFRFDVHALIFSDQAYKLEKALHDRFSKQRVNQVNGRKEFFRVSLDEVRDAIVDEFKGSSVEFHMQPDAKEFRQSTVLLK